MLCVVNGCGLYGIDGYNVKVETDISNGLPQFDIIGLGDTTVKESKDRVRAALKNCGYKLPSQRITINLSPAALKKEGAAYDLPIAIGIIQADQQMNSIDLNKFLFAGELSLDGTVRSVHGALSMAICAKEKGFKKIVLPPESAFEASVVFGIEAIPVRTLREAIQYLSGEQNITPVRTDPLELFSRSEGYGIDFADVAGQEGAKRALEVAAAGSHNCLMTGSPGCGKTMLAKRLPGILPDMTFEEALEVTRIYSVSGHKDPQTPLITVRPFRTPHHTITDVGLIGGGIVPKPGEVCLAHTGVLFMDEIPEFKQTALEALRQPVEDGHVTITRSNITFTYPSSFMLVCASNPCKCGYLYDKERVCICTSSEIATYAKKLSGPLLDRIDIHIEVPSVSYNEFISKQKGESSNVIKNRVDAARKMQIDRYKGTGIYSNSQLTSTMIKRYCTLGQEAEKLFKTAFEKLNLSARAHDRILKVARTIADLDKSNGICSTHLSEAIQYRSFDREHT